MHVLKLIGVGEMGRKERSWNCQHPVPLWYVDLKDTRAMVNENWNDAPFLSLIED